MKAILIFIFSINLAFAQSINGIAISSQSGVNGKAKASISGVNGKVINFSSNKKYLSLSGTDEYLSFTEINLGQTLSINLWVNIPSSPPAYSVWVGNSTVGTRNTAYQYAAFNRIIYANSSGSAYESYTEQTGWHMVTITVNGTALKVYVDNVQKGTGKTITAGDFLLAWIGRSDALYNTGFMDELVIYNKVITTGASSEVASLYGNGIPGDSDDYSPKNISGRLFYASFEQAYNTLVAETNDAGTTTNITQNNMEAGDIISY